MSIFEPLEGRRMMAAGDLDLTFGTGGKIIAQAVPFPVADIAVQADGRVVAVGSLNGDFAVVRLNPNGIRDFTFGGGDGIATSDFGGVGGDFANAVVVQPDGKIVVVGKRGSNTRDDTRFAVARYNPNGSPDNTFDGNGLLTVDMEDSQASAVAFQPDGKILVAGSKDSGRANTNDDFAVVRLLPNGSLDSTFGKTTLNPFDGDKRTGQATVDFESHTQDERATMIAVAPDGKIVVGGLGGNFFGTNVLKPAVARLNSDGRLDKNFGDGVIGDGKANNFAPLGQSFRDFHVGADGKITLVGGVNGNFLTVRLTSVGRLDKTFGGTGRVETDLGGGDDAKHALVNREGVLVAGGSSGKFALARYRLNGELDATFGQGGKVVTAAGPDDAILTTVPTQDGKLLAYGRTGSTLRYFAAVPKVNVFSLDPNGAESGGNSASLIFTRDIRASFKTTVFFDLSGTATFAADYNGPATTRPASTTGSLTIGELVGGITLGRTGFVDILPGETTAIVPINVIDDRVLESAETVRATIRTNSAYSLGDRSVQTIDIADNDIVRVNFQSTTGVNAFGYAADLGLPFGPRDRAIDPLAPDGQRFGWEVDNTANARFRGLELPGFIYNTFNHMQKPGGGTRWEIAVPNGIYEVKLAAGDPQNTDSVYRMNLEGQLALSGTPANQVRWFESTTRVQVSDGRLTLSNGAGAVNNKIAFLEIRPAAPGAAAGPVTANVPVSLPRVTPGQLNPRNGETIFSQLRI
jgi:uncharacterized delta-60 repeat protein